MNNTDVPIWDPMKNGLPFDAPWEDHMERDLEMLRESDAICLLPDWVESCGAKIELHQALEILSLIHI